MQEDQSLEEFRGAVRSQLEKKGVLDEVRAKLMAEILYSMTEMVPTIKRYPKKTLFLIHLFWNTYLSMGSRIANWCF
ncbi:hypothetical protein RS030_132031 [Cryptosporidium xiaoi]|uniref:Uncharacterized protein n=1 Tax=Cryptosporidium xiaoi TaxID=659607 RepID=A0AAV9Y1I8_9CRYT